jgi:predicted DNA-binding protein (MmcQ/YjbR family)
VLTPEQLLEHCLARPGAWPDFPWEHEHPVVKVADGRGGGKIFAFLGATTVGVKAGDNRDEADEWLARYPDDAAVMAYIGRSGWNTLTVGGAIADADVLEALDESYARVVAKLPRKHRPHGWDRT